ncbi:1766_t:CDS:2, partial [Funneliformis geosporum]
VSNLDIEALSRAISALTEEEEETSPQASVSQTEYRQKNILLTPELEARYHEVVQILIGLDDSLQLDYTKNGLKLENWIVNLDPNKKDCETIMNERKYHSDEVFETDEKLTKKEIKDHVRPKAKNHQIDMFFMFTINLGELLHLSDKVGENISHIDKSKSSENATELTISQLYHSDHSDDDNETDSNDQ